MSCCLPLSGRIPCSWKRVFGSLFLGFVVFFANATFAAERTIDIKVAQYDTFLELTCREGGAWAVGDKKGRLQPQEMVQLSGVLEKRAVKRYHVMVASARAGETQKLAELEAEWKAMGWPAKTMIIGRELLADDGKTILSDNRMGNVEAGVFGDQQSAQALVDKLAAQGKSSWIFTEVVSRTQGRLTLKSNGQVLAEGKELLLLPDQTVLLKKVEFAVGYPWHGFADRLYRGSFICRWGAQDALDCVLKTSLETILAGVVPSEISAKAEIGALQAQAVAARGEILGKIGQRHAGEGFDSCSEQHCQVFAGETPEALNVAKKIAPTCGVLMVDGSGNIAEAVYAANCGGRGEACQFVWTSPPNPILCGVWDSTGNPPSLDLSEEEQVGVFINNPPDCYCKDPAAEGSNSFRWKKSLVGGDWKNIENAIGVGRVQKISDIARGYSGRIYRMTFTGERGSRTVMKELNIRRLFGGLKSACFVASWTRDTAGFIIGAEVSGAGFGHGVGMCQTGAQSRARRGWSFDRILGYYFPGSSLKKWY
ncbi:MAG: SpoIID/LytB domain-containing protein [Candidatus Ozemobacteraceae bacterium]